MRRYEVGQIRNVGLVGHGGEGKTSLAEAMLFNAGAINRLGRVLDGSTVMDFDPDEIRREMSLSCASGFYEWKKHRVTIIDTPGDANFVADSRAALRVVDGLVVVIGADGGVKVQAEQLWAAADVYELPRLVFINRMDVDRADFGVALNELDKAFKQRGGTVVSHSRGEPVPIPPQVPVVIGLPIGQGESFGGVVDVLRMKALISEGDGSGKFAEEAVPAELEAGVQECREKLIEAVAEADDALLERYLEGETLSEDEILQGFRAGVASGAVVPVVAGSATRNIGVQLLMGLVVELLPSPEERGSVRGKDPKSEEEVSRKPSADEPFSALVYKTVADPFAGRLTLFRVLSGTLSSDSTVFNPANGVRERVGQLFYLQGKNQVSTEDVGPGEIAGVAKLKATNTGDTLCDEKGPAQFERIDFPEAVISVAIAPKSKGDEEKVSSALQRLQEEDLTVKLGRDSQTREMILSGLGELHLDVILERMSRKFGVEVEKRLPRVPYKETIKGSAKTQGRYKKQTGGRGQYGDTWLEVESVPPGTGIEFVNKIVGGAIPRQYIPAVEKGVRETMEEGILAGYPVVDLKVTLYDGSFHSVDSSEMAFKIAASLGFKKAVGQSKPVLLEPIMTIEVVVPEECMGDVIGDINARRGKVQGMEAAGTSQRIRALVPMAEVLTYSSNLRSMTGGRGSFTMSFSHYEELPHHLAEKVVAESGKAAQEEGR